ncbi:hypothetical protein [Arenimonas oryziterrae]|uniref:PKD domain-containing protein n=1 Tax=Arenimonas oryziterrae DSM 21050 = YC6267 TaxID=1121015 RepID=A0A091BI15_9GAMM|nr:hypothetical protein [Arenimonas oryziterrae]KFN43970.1 hypothetical protein N789_08450 [Arenimonas oryziterrae DSM 21050 = YC6267]
MNRNLSRTLFVSVLAGTMMLSACKKAEAPPPPPPPPAPMEPAPPPPPVAPTVSVVSVDLGSSVGADGKIAASGTTFAPKDTITASVATTTSDPAATVAGTLNAKWTYQDGQVVSEEPKSFSFAGPGVTNFQISKPDGWPAGKYKVEISLDGTVVQSKDFEVK